MHRHPITILCLSLLAVGLLGACADSPADPTEAPQLAQYNDPAAWANYCMNGYGTTYTIFRNFTASDTNIDWATGWGTRTLEADCYIGYPLVTPAGRTVLVAHCSKVQTTTDYGAFWWPSDPFLNGDGISCFPIMTET